MNKTPEGHNICDHCFEVMYEPKKYGPPPGMESLEERRLREAREAEERERKLAEIEARRGRKVRGWTGAEKVTRQNVQIVVRTEKVPEYS